MKAQHWETFRQDKNNHDYWEKPADEVMEFIKTQSPEKRPFVLDLGCGLGRHALEFAKNGFSVFASDDSITAIESVQDKAIKLNLDIPTSVCDFLEDGFPNQVFDIIISYNVIYHGYREQFQKAIRLIFDKLKKNGILNFTCPDRENGKYGYGKKVAPNTFLAEKSVTPGHIHYFADSNDLKELLSMFSEYSTKTFSGYWNNHGEQQYYSYWEVLASK